MKTNNFRRLGIGLALAGFVFFASAFNNKRVQYRFYNVSTNAASIDAADYQYQPDYSCNVLSAPSRNCSLLEDLSSAPMPGAHPSQAAVDAANENNAIQKGATIED